MIASEKKWRGQGKESSTLEVSNAKALLKAKLCMSPAVLEI